MNIYQKIQLVKLELAQRELKKSGENKFSGFKYYELGDILPSIIELCNKHDLFTQITFTETQGVLNIIDCAPEKKDNDNDNAEYRVVQYTSPLKDLELKGANAIQALGGVETYLRRYSLQAILMLSFKCDDLDGADIMVEDTPSTPKVSTKPKSSRRSL